MMKWLNRWFRKEPEPELNPESRQSSLESVLGIDISPEHAHLFKRALRHRSIMDNNQFSSYETYERLEFLGDAVLDLIVTEILFDRFDQENEGFLTKLRAKLVRADTLYEFALKLNLNHFLEIGERASGQGIELSKSVLSDVYEAITAAIYVSNGYDAAYHFVNSCIERFIDFDDIITKIDNYKSLLMEYSQSERLELPRYSVISEDGPGHDKTFHVAVYIGSKMQGEGTGKSKKNAEQQAARSALKNIS